METITNFLKSIAGALLLAALFACERMPDKERELQLEQARIEDSLRVVRQDSIVRDSVARAERRAAENARPKTANEALKQDAQLARTMSLERFAQHMKSRESYYRQFEEVSYEDEFVKIKMEGDELKIETPKGKAKFEDGESKIKTDTYKRKVEKD